MATEAGVPVNAPGPAAPHAEEVAAVLAALVTDQARGLSGAEVARRRARDGLNALPEARPTPLLVDFLGQFKSPLIWLLLAAAVVAVAMGERADAAVIAAVLLGNALVGTVQERRAARSVSALKKLSTTRARVVRDGEEATVDAAELVAGDVVLLAGGDAVPADARLLEAAQLACSEAALTGESVPASKGVAPAAAAAVLAERTSMVFSGTLVTSGRGRAAVVATGPRTELGRIAGLTQGAEEPTPLEARLSQFGRLLAVLAVALFGLVLGVGWLRGLPMNQVLLVGISQLVSVVPEGLPIALTIALAVGMRRMAQRKALVRHLGAVETLGCTTVICTDKTGTLTRNEMTVVRAWLPDGRVLEPAALGTALAAAPAGPVAALLDAATSCNDATLAAGAGLGDPTELALLALARDTGWRRAPRPRLGELPFDPGRRLMATAHPGVVLVKGATDAVLALCRLDEEDRRPVRAADEAMAADALRVLAFARVDGALDEAAGWEGLAGRATLLGLCGEEDPPREGARAAVAACRAAGIRVVMVTGDHRATGQAIARQVGLAGEGDLAVDLSRDDLEAVLARDLDRVVVFARVQPEQKLRIVEALQQRGEVVAMTGDGVNDAPALVRSDVGVGMGRSGTDVAREASDLVIADDDFATLVRAVEEGRIVYRNIKKATLLLLASSLAEMLILVVAMAVGLPMPFAAVQILWNNVVTEGTITLNFVLEPGEGDELRRPPIRRDEPIVTPALGARLTFLGTVMAVVVLGFYAWRRARGLPAAQVQTETFTLLAVCEWFNVLNCRSSWRSAFGGGLMRNPWLVGGLLLSVALQAAVIFVPPLNGVFHTVPLTAVQVALVVAVASLVLWAEELRKRLVRARRARVPAGAGA